jgi:hypothetical protein
MPNDCLVPGTEPIADRASFNFCEEFSLNKKGATKNSSASEASKNLFGDDDDLPPPKDFGSLFNHP